MMKTYEWYKALTRPTCMVIGGLLLAGCSGASPHTERPFSGAVGTTPLRTPETKTEAALRAYEAMWRDLARASETSDAGSPLLDDHATGGALELMRYGLRKSKKEQVVGRGRPVAHPEVVAATSRKVVLVDCVDERHWLQYRLDGELRNDVPGGHFRADATVRRSSAGWQVTDLYMQQAGSC
ncbi:hypothetical protein [Streptomyces sp. TS71-3]|uniref:hypothetical protein n=1 Tax=Streptomyces sp. TS71-3 TaxID=2733862 RepID=UPI001B2DCB08|nr:hypothetical protein [Streptomyces sp. TS71-3]GHJ35433.1 hypothetical protein Sm713_10420 [Streptomyces sp. TS71-3]